MFCSYINISLLRKNDNTNNELSPYTFNAFEVKKEIVKHINNSKSYSAC